MADTTTATTTAAPASETAQVEVVDVDATTVANEQQEQPKKSTKIAESMSAYAATLLSSKDNAQAYADFLKKRLTRQQLTKLLAEMEALVQDGKANHKDSIRNKVWLHYVSGRLCRQLDHEFNATRTDFCPDEGTGAYFEAGPHGHAGFGLGIVTKSNEDGATVTKRTGVGVYLRADHIMDAGYTGQTILEMF